MPEVFTLSGSDYVELLGAAPPAVDVACAQKVKTTVLVGAASALGAIPVGIFGVYKLAKGRGAAGATALLAGGALFWIGRGIYTAAAQAFERCRKT